MINNQYECHLDLSSHNIFNVWYLLRSACASRCIGRREISISHGHWWSGGLHASWHPSLPGLLWRCFAMSSSASPSFFCRLLAPRTYLCAGLSLCSPMMWPAIFILLVVTMSWSRYMPALLVTSSCVAWSRHEMPSIVRRQRRWKTGSDHGRSLPCLTHEHCLGIKWLCIDVTLCSSWW